MGLTQDFHLSMGLVPIVARLCILVEFSSCLDRLQPPHDLVFNKQKEMNDAWTHNYIIVQVVGASNI